MTDLIKNWMKDTGIKDDLEKMSENIDRIDELMTRNIQELTECRRAMREAIGILSNRTDSLSVVIRKTLEDGLKE